MPLDDLIFKRLRLATSEDIKGICDILGINKVISNKEDLFSEISKEFRSVAGHSIVNIFRKMHELPYKQILIDVHNKISSGGIFTKSKYHIDDHYDEINIENDIMWIMQTKANEELSKLPPERRQKILDEIQLNMMKDGRNTKKNIMLSSFAVSATVGTLTAETVASIIFAESLKTTFWASLFGTSAELATSSIILGGAYVAAPIMVLGTAMSLMSPSYKKTIGVCFKLISIRKRHEASQELDL